MTTDEEATDLWLMLLKLEAADRGISLDGVSEEILRVYAAKGYTVGKALEEITK